MSVFCLRWIFWTVRKMRKHFCWMKSRQGMAQMIEEQQEQKRCDRKMEQQVNHLDDTLHQLADEKGRAVTIDELAKYMKMSEEEILDIMKLAGEDLYEKYKKTDDKNPDDTKPEL